MGNEYKLERKRCGLCVDCGNCSPCEGQTLCLECKQKKRKTSKKVREQRKLNGLCPLDGNPAKKDCVLCQKCTDRLRTNNSKRRQLLLEQHVCLRCGRGNLTRIQMCQDCYLKLMAGKYLGSKNRGQELKRLLEKQNSCCPYTGIDLVLCENASLDHIFPVSKGGNDDISNLQWVYLPINSMKLNHTESEFLLLVSKIAEYRKL